MFKAQMSFVLTRDDKPYFEVPEVTAHDLTYAQVVELEREVGGLLDRFFSKADKRAQKAAEVEAVPVVDPVDAAVAAVVAEEKAAADV